MAYPIPGTQSNELVTSNVTSYTPAVTPSGLIAGDIVLAFVVWNSNSAVISCATSGWSAVGTRGANPAAAYGQFFYAIAGVGGAYNVPTFTSTGSARLCSVIFAVRDADTTAPIDVALQTNYSGTATPATGTPTTTANNALVLHGWSNGGIGTWIHPDRTKAQVIDMQNSASNSPGAMVSFAGQVAAGAVEGYTAALNTTTGGVQWTVAIKNKAGGRPASDVRYDLSVVSWYGNAAANIDPLTWRGLAEAGNSFAGGITGGALDGVSLTVGTVTATNTPAQTNLASSATNNVLDGAWHAIPATDCTGKIFTAEVQTSRPGNNFGGPRIGRLGYLIGFSDGTNYQIFRVKNPELGWLASVDYRVWVACGVSQPMYSRGTLDWSAITQVGYFLHHLLTAVDTLSMSRAFLISGCALTGGSEDVPTSAQDFARIMLQSRLTGIVALQSTAQVQVRHSLTVGDGVRPTYYSSEAAAVAFPQRWSATQISNWQDEWQVDDGACRIAVKAGAGDHISFGASVLSSQTRQAFTFDPASSASATYDFGGASFVGLDNVWNSDAPCSLATFLRCHQITGQGATFDTCTFKSCASPLTAYVTVTAGAAFLGCTFVRGQEMHAIQITQAGSYDLSDTTFTGYTTVLDVTPTTGTVSITLQQGQTQPTYSTAGATVEFVQPVSAATGSVTGIVTGSRLQVYNETTSTEVYNDVLMGTSYTNTYTDGTTFTAGDVVRVRLAWMDGATAKLPVQYRTVATASGWAILADQQDDTVYNGNGIDGDTVTEFTPDYPNVEIDVNDPDGVTTVQRGYAWYISGQMTADGLRYYHGAMTAEDAVNYRVNVGVADMHIQNAGAGALLVTGGRLYRSDGSPVAVPGGGPLQMEYGRAYSVETGVSGLTPAESDRLMQTALQTTAQEAARNAALAAALSA